ncbi:hypothetical protein D5F01_LYC22338 [Larimichthys crocea]|uniref:Uncharacterized protein n=1 Tax=Larimichthys crocea TaxID=215358 RepID=A0A6G0HLY0_LARCR|nr:hypothetical protein D5F01_LYC22338 [Larimichthys crocea]
MASTSVFSRLTRRHGIKIGAGSPCSVEEVALHAACMNSVVVLFLETVEQVNRLVETGITVNGMFEPVMPLTQPATKITLSNVPPFISDDFLTRELSRHGKVVSPIRKYSAAELLRLRGYLAVPPPVNLLRLHPDIALLPRRRYTHRGSRRSFHSNDASAITSIWSTTRRPRRPPERAVNSKALAIPARSTANASPTARQDNHSVNFGLLNIRSLTNKGSLIHELLTDLDDTPDSNTPDSDTSDSEIVITSRSTAQFNQADTVVFEPQNQSTPKRKPEDEG